MMDNQGKPVVWGVGTARTIRPHWALCELGIEYETREIIPRTSSMDDPEFLKRSARGKVPIFEDDNLVLGESAAIVTYLADRYRDHCALIPAYGSVERAQSDERCSFILMELDGPLYVIRRHQGLPEIYGESETAVAAAQQYFLRQSGVIADWLDAPGPYLLGDQFCVADILLGSCESWAQFISIELPPTLAEHLAEVTEREAFKRAFETNFPPAAMAELARNLK